MLKSDDLLDLDLPTDVPDLPPPRLSNEAYLAWMRHEWEWIERDGRRAQVMRQRQAPVIDQFVLP